MQQRIYSAGCYFRLASALQAEHRENNMKHSLDCRDVRHIIRIKCVCFALLARYGYAA
ncbi:MAG: hypothetical protein LBH25_07505 [Fibromonadaceae bacterium]|nr:hypothetical protein [Fibromonadaceae bacterium]